MSSGPRIVLVLYIIRTVTAAGGHQVTPPPASVGPVFAAPVGNQTAAIGREAVFTCSIRNIEKYKVGWLRTSDRTILSVHARTVTHNTRISVSYETGGSGGGSGSFGTNQTSEETNIGTWRLHIRHLKESDRDCYMCQINTSPMRSEEGCLDILVPPDIVYGGETSADLAVSEGDNATLTCSATGRPAPRVSWRREDGEPILTRSSSSTSSGLNHSSVDISDDNSHDKENIGNQENQEISADNENQALGSAESVVLDEDTIKLLGEKTASTEGAVMFHAELSSRITQWTQDGLKKDEKLELLDTYPRKGSVLLEAPILNPEIEITINDSVKKRDKSFTSDQNIIGSAISAVGTGLSTLLVRKELNKDDREFLIKYQLDAVKLLSEAHYQATKARKVYIYPGLDRKAKAVLEKTKSDDFLFGSELSEKLRAAKSLEKVGMELKPLAAPKKPPPRISSAGNWRSPFVKNQGQPQTGIKSRNAPRTSFQGSRNQADRSQGPQRNNQDQRRSRDSHPSFPRRQ